MMSQKLSRYLIAEEVEENTEIIHFCTDIVN